MTFIDHWYRLQRSNRSLNDDATKMTITVASFKAQLQKAYDSGVADGKAVKPPESAEDKFRKMFGF